MKLNLILMSILFSITQANAQNISPTKKYIGGSHGNVGIFSYDTNEGSKGIVSFKVFKVVDGVQQDVETDEVKVFPPTIKVTPSSKYTVKLLSRTNRGDEEKAYRFIASFTPEKVACKTDEECRKVSIAPTYNVPIFITAINPIYKIDKKVVDGGVEFINVGNSTYRAIDLIVNGERVKHKMEPIYPNQKITVKGFGSNVEIGENILLK